MNLDDLLQLASQPPQAGTAAGQLFVIRCVPDPFTGEVLNIGVCGIDPGGRRLVKVIDEPGRLKCLYGEEAATVVRMAQVAREAAERGLQAPSEQLLFDTPLPFYNSTLEQAVQDSFRDQVTVALPQREQRRVSMVDDEAALSLTLKVLRQELELEADEMLPDPYVLVPMGEGQPQRSLHIPLRPRYGYGVVRSADYQQSTLRGHLYDSLLDLNCAGRYRMRQLQSDGFAPPMPGLAIFVFLNPEMSRQQRTLADRVLEDVTPRATGLAEIVPAVGAHDLGQQIASWRLANNELPYRRLHS